jgi:hypothetical protein
VLIIIFPERRFVRQTRVEWENENQGEKSMRLLGLKFVSIFFLSMMMGCATLTKVDPQSGLQVNYTGPARGAVELVRVTDSRPYTLAEKAMEKGMATTLRHGDTRFTAGGSYDEEDGSVGGYAAPTVTYGKGGFTQTGRSSGLPSLTVPVRAVDQSTEDPIVECPKNRAPRTVPEQAACAMMGVETLVELREK